MHHHIINRNIIVSDQEKRKNNRNRDKIRELVNPKTSQKKRKNILVQEGGAFLAPLLELSLEVWSTALEGYYRRIND